LRAGAFVLLTVVVLLLSATPAGAAQNTIAQPDDGGQYTSLELDSAGNPVVSHYDAAIGELRIVHCATADCTGSRTLASPDATTNDVGERTSLALAAGDVPVATYYDVDVKDLKFVHCGNAACTAPTIRTIDSVFPPNINVGLFSSIVVNGSGNPVIAYYTEPFDILKLVICSDPTCGTYNDYDVDAVAITGLYPSLKLDALGFPVISYYDQSAADLKVVRCQDATCSTKVITTVDGSGGDAGKYTSLALDAAGFPVVSYYNESQGDLKVIHCGDANCSGGNTIASPDSTGDVGQHTSLVLDAAGNPIVSYYNVTGTALRVLHCGNAACMAGNTITTPDAAGNVGEYTSLALDGVGSPVVSYYDASDMKLNVLHCGDPACAGTSIAVGGVTELSNVLQRSGSVGHSPLFGLGALAGLVLVTAAVGGLVALRGHRAS